MTLLRRHALWLIIAALVGIAGAWLLSTSEGHSYASTAQVDVEPNPTLNTPIVPNMATEAQVATSGVMVGRTAAQLHVSPGGLSGHLSASVSSTATVLSISCKMPTAAWAQECAQAAATAYIGFRNQPTGTSVQQQHDPLHVTLVTPATLPQKPAGPGKRTLLPIGALLGLALGVGAITIRDHYDDRVRDRADLERCLEGSVLAEIPRVRNRAMDPASVFRRQPRSSAAEAYRYLRLGLMPLVVPTSGGGRILLVAGPRGLEGRTSVAANLATALAQAGASVLLVDADFRPRQRGLARRPHRSLSELFRATGRPGLSELIAGKATLDDVGFTADLPDGGRLPFGATLRFVAAGDLTAHAADITDGSHLAAALMTMRAAADVVVLDSAPVLSASYVMALAQASDVAVLVADPRRTSRQDASTAAQNIRASGTRGVVGLVNRGAGVMGAWVPSAPSHDRGGQAPWAGGPAAPGAIVADAGPGSRPGSRPGCRPGDEPGLQRPVHLAVPAAGSYGDRDPGSDGDDPLTS
jgi:Mrp family chromosome partitioning ATPase